MNKEYYLTRLKLKKTGTRKAVANSHSTGNRHGERTNKTTPRANRKP